MRFMMIVKANKDSEAGVMPDEKLIAAMTRYNEEMAKAGVLLDLAGLQPSSKGARVRFSGTKRTVIDGPFTETKELIAGYWVWKVKSKEEAIDWVKRCPNPMPGQEAEIEIRQIFEAEDFGAELTPDYTLTEAGMTRPKVKEQAFIGKDAYLRQRAQPPCAVLCTLTVDSHASADGTPRYMLGGEPILSLAGERLVDAKGRPSYVTSAGSGPSVGRHLLMAYLPADCAVEGRPLLVEYMGEQYPVTVAVAGATPLFDPSNERVRQ